MTCRTLLGRRRVRQRSRDEIVLRNRWIWRGQRLSRIVAALAALVTMLGGCAGGPLLANPAAQRPVATVAPKPSPTTAHDPVPIVLPADDAPHRRLTEWWYYTGHLRDAAGGHFGFEFVVFRAERGGFPVSWASHLALTDESGGRFAYAQRSEVGGSVDQSAGSGGFNFAVGRPNPSGPGQSDATPWRMARSNGADLLQATAGPDEAAGNGAGATGAGAAGADATGPGATGAGATAAAGFGLDLLLRARTAPVLHDRDGWIDFGAAGGSYYYSRTRLSAQGAVIVGGRRLTVDGTAWFDHQWGDFIALGGGGWDWFAINVDDGTDIMLSLVRDREGGYPLVYGTLVQPDGTAGHLDRNAFSVTVSDRWRSPTTGAEYPAAWEVTLPGEGLRIDLKPTVPDQELDTRPTTGVVYWEGSQQVTAARNGGSIGGQAYVELTGYSPPPATP
jgi:predicted secreted hydrolase